MNKYLALVIVFSVLRSTIGAAVSLEDFRHANKITRAAAKDDYQSCAMRLDGKEPADANVRVDLARARERGAAYLARYSAATDPVEFAQSTRAESRTIAEALDDFYSRYAWTTDEYLHISAAANPVKLIRNYEGLRASDVDLEALARELTEWEARLLGTPTIDQPLFTRFWWDVSVLQQATTLAGWRGSHFVFPTHLRDTLERLYHQDQAQM